MKYNIITGIGVLIIIAGIYIDTYLRHNSSNPTGTEYTFAAIMVGMLIVFVSGYFKWKDVRRQSF